MATVSEKIKDRFESARAQIEGFEKEWSKRVDKLEKRAKAQIDGVKEAVDEVPAQLKGAWESVVTRLRVALAFATRDELNQLSERVDDLAKKVEKLIRGDKIRAAAQKTPKKS